MVRTVVACAVLAALVATILLVTQPAAGLSPTAKAIGTLIAWALFAAGAWSVRRLPPRAAAALIVVGGVALPLAAILAPPRTSDDLYRYVWDGRVQAAGIDPYRYPPADPELLGLRDPRLWPTRSAWCVADGTTDPDTGRPLAPGCTLINRPTVRTIYPPVAQAYFVVLHVVSPSLRAPQVAGAVFAIAMTLLLLAALPRLGLDVRRAALWAWCPLVALEAGNNAHVDVVAAFLTVAALVVVARSTTARADTAAGGLLGLAVATKLTPALVVPALLRRPVPRLFAVGGAAVLTVATVYLPHVLAVGPAVLGYLAGYLGEEGYGNGSRFALLTPLVPTSFAPAIAVAVLAVVAAALAWKADPERPWRGAVVMTGTALVVAAPAYPWYAILLVALVALDGRAEWLAVAVAGHVVLRAADLSIDAVTAQRVSYGLAAAAVVGVGLARRWRPALFSRNELAMD
jgi:hypothetical protein